MKIMDIVCILIVVFYIFLGYKRGVIKGGVQLVGTVAVLVISYILKDVLANFLMNTLPFMDFPGSLNGLTTMNILFFELISFVVVFVVLYCVLNILLSISGFIENLLKITVILAIPSKILGALLGLIEGIIMAFLIMFILYHFPTTEKWVNESKVAIVVLERTPIIGNISLGTTLALEEISKEITDIKENKNKEDVNFKILHILIHYKVIEKEDAQKLIDSNKIKFTNEVTLAGG